LGEKIAELANEVFELKGAINNEISGSIFRLYGSYILRVEENLEEASRWIKLAIENDRYNHKTIALKAELLCHEKKWDHAEKILRTIADTSTERLVKTIYSECLTHTHDAYTAFNWLKKQSNVKDDPQIKLNLAMLAELIDKDDFAIKILKELKESTHPGPYPYLINAQILAKKASPRGPFTFTTSEDMELLSNRSLLVTAVKDLEQGIELLKLTERSGAEIAKTATSLAKINIMLGDATAAAKHLRKYWQNYLRDDSHAWFIASTLAVLNDKKDKAIKRARMSITLSSKGDYEFHLRLATLYLKFEEWEDCLNILSGIKTDDLENVHLNAILQMKLICYYGKKELKNAEDITNALKHQFPNDVGWALHKALFLVRSGNLGDAVSLLEEIKVNLPDSLEINLRLASLYLQEKEFSKSSYLYRDIGLSKGDISILEHACSVAFNSNEAASIVLSVVNKAERSGLISDSLLHFKAVALTMNRQIDDALELFISFPEESLNHNDYEAFAVCYENKTLTKKAIKILEKAKSKFPKDMRFVRRLCSLYLKTNNPPDAFKEAKCWLENIPEEKAAYFAVMQTGFAIGEQKVAHEAMLEYLSRFGEGPELRTAGIEELRELFSKQQESSELLLTKYQAGQLPEAYLTELGQYGIGGVRVNLLRSSSKVMAFDGSIEAQEKQKHDTISAKEVLLDYHALLTVTLLDLFDQVLELFDTLNIPEVMLDELRNELATLSTSYQRDRRKVEESVFSKSKTIFQVIDAFPEINPDDIPKTLGNTIYDLLVCKNKMCTYVTTGFNREELSDIKSFSDKINVVSVLDIVDLLKENGKISVSEHKTISDKLEMRQLVKCRDVRRLPERLMFDHCALEMLEECGAGEFLHEVGLERYIGPFSIFMIKKNIEYYNNIDDIHNKLCRLNERLSALLSAGKCKIVQLEKPAIIGEKTDSIPVKYLDGLRRINKEKAALIWTDDICVKKLFDSEMIKTSSTRTVLDVLLAKDIISKEQFTQKVIQLIKWNMYFCWINPNLLFTCAEMYDFSMSSDLQLLINQLTDEIQRFENKVPNATEMTNFTVLYDFIRDLWTTSDKAQVLALQIFDLIRQIINDKELLDKLWISRCITSFATLDTLIVEEFLKALSLRLISTLNDKLGATLLLAIEVSLAIRDNSIIKSTYSRHAAVNLIKAVKKILPHYENLCVSKAIELDPTIKILL